MSARANDNRPMSMVRHRCRVGAKAARLARGGGGDEIRFERQRGSETDSQTDARTDEHERARSFLISSPPDSRSCERTQTPTSRNATILLHQKDKAERNRQARRNDS